MQNFDAIERNKYRSADVQNDRTIVVYFYDIFVLTFKIIFIMLKEMIMGLLNPSKLKNISGQLALVTGENLFIKC
jgi:hypothetical protein